MIMCHGSLYSNCHVPPGNFAYGAHTPLGLVSQVSINDQVVSPGGTSQLFWATQFPMQIHAVNLHGINNTKNPFILHRQHQTSDR